MPGLDSDYEPISFAAPALTGTPLRLFVALADSPLFGPVRSALYRSNGMPQLLEETEIPADPLFMPDTAGWRPLQEGNCITLPPTQAGGEAVPLLSMLTAHASSPSRVVAFHRAYASGVLTPSQVAERIIAAVEESEAMAPPMRMLISFKPEQLREQAARATQRFRAGAPLSLVDGVPFAVKDVVDVEGHPTSAGTAFMAERRATEGTVPGVAALLAAGAVLVGKSNMHEIGLGTTGTNTVHGTPRNPHNPRHHTGGSSSGSGALVAAGLVAFALGSDGGGSIRIPSALCGCVGLKPTHHRVCSAPEPRIAHSVAVLGPMAATVTDVALLYSQIANTGHALHSLPIPPPLTLPNLSTGAVTSPSALAGKTAGMYWPWFEHAAPQVVALCKAAVGLLQARGLEVREVKVPGLWAASVAHSATIATEMRSCMTRFVQDASTRRQLNPETRISLAVAEAISARAYIGAQKVRRRLDATFRRLLTECDFIITPTVPLPAPAIRPAAAAAGESDLVTTVALMRFMQPANLLGLPAITVPVGAVPAAADAARGGAGGGGPLPVGLQIMGPAWHEAALLHAAAVLEAALGVALPQPELYWDLLKQQG